MAKKDPADQPDQAEGPEQPAAQPAKPVKYDETIPGGKYVSATGTLKNAHGQPIDEDGKVIDGSSVPQVDIPAQEPPPTQ
jgi:hypothetical protein